MKRLTIFVLFAATLWGLFWSASAFVTKRAVHEWIETQQSLGWIVDYSDLRVRGFPNRIDLTVTDLTVADPVTQMVWEAPFLQSHALVYKPLHQIVTFPNNQTISGRNHVWHVTSEGLRASVVANAAGHLLRFRAEAPVFNIESQEKSFAFVNLNSALEIDENSRQTYRMTVTSDAALASGAALDQVRLDATLNFDHPLRAVVIEGPRPQPTRIDIRLAEYISQGLEMKIAGAVDLDAYGQPTGEMTVKAVNWRDMLAEAVAAGFVPDALAGTMESALSLLAGTTGNKDTLDLPLTYRQGSVFLGFIPLGKAPRIQF